MRLELELSLQLRPTVGFDRPLRSAIDETRPVSGILRNVTPAMLTTTASTWSTLMRGWPAPSRSSTNPSSRAARPAAPCLRTVSAAIRNSSPPQQSVGHQHHHTPASMRARKATAWARWRPPGPTFQHHTLISGQLNNGSNLGPRRGTGTSEEAVIHKLTTDLRRRTLASQRLWPPEFTWPPDSLDDPRVVPAPPPDSGPGSTASASDGGGRAAPSPDLRPAEPAATTERRPDGQSHTAESDQGRRGCGSGQCGRERPGPGLFTAAAQTRGATGKIGVAGAVRSCKAFAPVTES